MSDNTILVSMFFATGFWIGLMGLFLAASIVWGKYYLTPFVLVSILYSIHFAIKVLTKIGV